MAIVSEAALAGLPLVRDGRAAAVLVTARAPLPVARYAADEFVYHVRRATGVSLNVVPENALPPDAGSLLYIGACDAARSAGIDETALDDEATVLQSHGSAVFIVGNDGEGEALDGNTRAGTLWGVYELLERVLQVRWLWPGELGTFIPETDTVAIPVLDETVRPRLWQRNVRPGLIKRTLRTQPFTSAGLKAYKQAQTVFLRRHRMGRKHVYRYGHAFNAWWDKYGEEHPDWFQLLPDGKRGPSSPNARFSMCVSAPGLHRQIVASWKEWRGANPGVFRNVNCCENDIRGLCVCDACTAWDGPQPDEIHPRFGPRVVSDRYARSWQAVRDLAAKEDPDAIVMAYAYVNYAPPPSPGISLHPNVLIGSVPDLFFPRTAAHQDWVKQQWMGWRRTGCSLFLRPNYMLHGYVMPHIFAHQFAAEFQFEWHNGMVATDFDSLNGQWATQGTNLYALMRLHTQADRDIDDILAEYYAAFGPASEQVRRYFDYWEQFTTKMLESAAEPGASGIVNWSRYARDAHVLFPSQSFEPALAILADAKRATGDQGQFAARVQFLSLGLEHAMLCARVGARVAGVDPDVSPYTAARAVGELQSFRLAHEGSFISNLMFAAFIEGRSWELPGGWDGRSVVPVQDSAAPLRSTQHFSLRGSATMLAALPAGESFRARIVTKRVGRNEAPITWVLVSTDDRVIRRGSIPVTQAVDVDVPVPAPGTYALFIQTNKNNAKVTLLNDHAALTGERFAFIYAQPEAYFLVPDGLQTFTVSFQGSWPGETVRVCVRAPDGKVAASGEVTRKDLQTIAVRVPDGQSGKPWSLSYEATDKGVLEDYTIVLSADLPPFLAHEPERLVRWAKPAAAVRTAGENQADR